MRGLTVVGCGLEAGEILVAAALCDAVRAAGEDAALVVTAAMGPRAEEESEVAIAAGAELASCFRTTASPLIAARHSGDLFDPAALVARAAEAGPQLVISAAPGPLLAPLTEHYSNRDFARELGTPLVLAARAGGGVTGLVRTTGEAARAAGLAVAAVVLTEWPDPPNRVQLDERELLQKLVRVPVLTLPEAARSPAALTDAARGWPIASWTAAEAPAADAPPAATEAALAQPAPVTLEPYEAWQPRQVGDPRSTPRPQIMATMLEIIEAEGPMTTMRAYSLYNRAAGGRKLTTVAKAPLSSAVYWLARENKVTLTREAEIPWQGDDMVRLPDQPAVRLRELGPRSLDEVPLDEIAELVKLIRGSRGSADQTELKRAVLNAYGLVRLTGRADDYLGLAIDLAS